MLECIYCRYNIQRFFHTIATTVALRTEVLLVKANPNATRGSSRPGDKLIIIG